MSIKVAIAGDHAGFDLKKKVLRWLQEQNFETTDFGPYTPDSMDYPDTVHPLASGIQENKFDFGILICGSGNGVCMTANKYQTVRAALVWNNELAALARQHNNANVLCLPARFISEDDGLAFAQTFLSTDFEGGRHQNRVDKIAIK